MEKEINIQDERLSTLYGEKPIVIPKERYDKIVNCYVNFHKKSNQWFKNNYENNFCRYMGNFLSISGEIIKPWPDANDYFMPVTVINIETILARTMETIRGGRDFITLFPRGRNDEANAKVTQLYLRYMFETPMKGHSKLVDGNRTKFIYGTSIYTMPWELEYGKKQIPGKYIFDKETDDFIREAPEESGLPADSPKKEPPPKDFSDVDVQAILDSNPNYILKDLIEDVKLIDNPNLEIQDIFSVKVDSSGGQDIQKHKFTIIETVETIDTIKRKVGTKFYDKDQFDALLKSFANEDKKDPDQPITSANIFQDNSGKELRDAIEGNSSSDMSVENGVKIWTCYGRHDLGRDFEEETITIIANSKFIFRMVRTPFMINGRTYRPILVDRYITLPYKFYGLGPAQIIESLNYLLNHLVNQILNHGDLYNSPPLITPAEGQWAPEENIFGPGQVWTSDNSDGFKILETPDIKASQITMITFIEGFIQKTLGISDFTLGQGAGSIVKNDTAHGLANILRETNRRLDFYAQNSHENFLKEMIEMILWESQQFLDKVEIPKITDMTKEEIKFTFNDVNNDDIQGLYDVKIFADSLTSSKEFEQLKWQTQIATLGALTDPQTKFPLYSMQMMGDKYLEAFGEPFPEKLHYVPKPNIPIPPSSPEEGPDNLKTPTEKMSQPEGRLGALKP